MKPSLGTLAAALAITLVAAPAPAQHTGHDHHAVPAKPAPKKPPAKKATPAPKPPPARAAATAPAKKPVSRPQGQAARPAAPAPAKAPAAVDHAAMGHDHGMDHAAMGHTPPASAADGTGAGATSHADMDHAAMGHGAGHRPAAGDGGAPARDAAHGDHGTMAHGAMDHAAMGHGVPAPGGSSQIDHAAMGHGPRGDLPADAAPRTPIPVPTDSDRAAAFPPHLHGHTAHDERIHSYWLADRLEWQDTGAGTLGWEGVAWIGGDIHRLWLRSEGEAEGGEIEHGDLEVLYGRSITPWWDVVAGVRQDVGHGPSRTWAAIGVQGLAPYKFEVEATAYVGSGGRTALALEAEYDTLITNRLILQWQAEASLHGRDDPALGIGSGLSTVEAGARLRYEITRRFAPYVGVQVERAFGGTADLRRAEGEPTRDTRLVAGIRFWF